VIVANSPHITTLPSSGRGAGRGVALAGGEEPNHMTARKPSPL
jgi:hypothetical protein